MPVIRQTYEGFDGIFTDAYQSPVYNDFNVAMKAKRNCRRCYGTGQLSFDNPTTKRKWTETCPCVHRKER